jgi:hypothetical protein
MGKLFPIFHLSSPEEEHKHVAMQHSHKRDIERPTQLVAGAYCVSGGHPSRPVGRSVVVGACAVLDCNPSYVEERNRERRDEMAGEKKTT